MTTKKCAFCEGEAGNNRECELCESPLCWNHVVRISVAIHDDGTCYEAPFYLCRECVSDNQDIIKAIKSKFRKTDYWTYQKLLSLVR